MIATRNAFCVAAVMAAAFVSDGCSGKPETVAAAGGAPAMNTVPVGPIPGPKVDRPTPSNPYGDSAVARSEGRQLFVQFNCAGCHGGHAGGGMGPSLRDPSWRYGDSDAHVFESISQGRGQGMPSWGTKIPQEQIWKLVAYIKTLATPEEADKPQ